MDLLTSYRCQLQGTRARRLSQTETGSPININQLYWFHTTGFALAALLQSAGYGHPAQVKILRHFADVVAPNLGVAPDSGLSRWKSFMTDDYTPIELSWDFHTGASRPSIRYSVEPVGPYAGTAADPYNHMATIAFKRGFLKASPDAYVGWLNHFEACFGQDWDMTIPEGHLSNMFWAFDLDEDNATSKAYFFPGAKAYASGRSKLDVITEAVSSLPNHTGEAIIPFQTFTRYAHKTSLEVEMVAIDLIRDSRLKLYYRDRRTTFASVQDNMTLGSQLDNDDLQMGLNRLRRLWHFLFAIDEFSDDASLRYDSHRTAGILYNVEFHLRGKAPKVKIYIPVRHYGESDRQITVALTKYLIHEVGSQEGFEAAIDYAHLYSSCLDSILSVHPYQVLTFLANISQ
ncbi:hypothetical protein S40293_03995 [Stachybotrys chartarum IBT 40293]|nr:hypothetical protein S40293_03995 [Stachybotrys chartarum IBT 40293]